MKTISFDFGPIKSYADFYTALNDKIALPGYFGRNLDALHDFLTGEAEMPLQIEFRNCNAFQMNAFSRLIRVMQDAQQELEDFEFTIA